MILVVLFRRSLWVNVSLVVVIYIVRLGFQLTMEDIWPASDLPREGFDDGIYASEVMSGLDGGELTTCFA